MTKIKPIQTNNSINKLYLCASCRLLFLTRPITMAKIDIKEHVYSKNNKISFGFDNQAFLTDKPKYLTIPYSISGRAK